MRTPITRRSRGSLAALIVSITLLVTVDPTRADVDGNRYVSEDWGVRISAPSNWQLSQQTSYPNILLWMYRHKPRGKMLLGAEQLETKLTSREYADRTAVTLRKLGDKPKFTVGKPQLHAATGAYWVSFNNGKTFLRQALLVSGNIGYSLTLSAPNEKTLKQHVRAWDYALRSVRINRKRTQGDGDSNDDKGK